MGPFPFLYFQIVAALLPCTRGLMLPLIMGFIKILLAVTTQSNLAPKTEMRNTEKWMENITFGDITSTHGTFQNGRKGEEWQ